MLTMIDNKESFIRRLLSICLLLILHLMTVRSSELIQDNSIEFSGYSELYYTFDFTNPKNIEKGNFIVNHKRNNSISTNILIGKAAYTATSFRSTLGLMIGDYSTFNLINEKDWAKNIYEAQAGLLLSSNKNIWLDIGVMPSHIGFESVIGKDCWNVTRSILAENSPYYETGAKISYISDDTDFQSSLLFLNGWQNISADNLYSFPAIGFQIQSKLNKNTIVNYSNYIGYSTSKDKNKIRTYHNFYLVNGQDNKLSFIAGLDIGTDNINNQYGYWFSPILIARYAINPNIKASCRLEYFNDSKGLIIPTNDIEGFNVKGFSTNVDYQIQRNCLFRIEAKLYHSDTEMIWSNTQSNLSITSSISYTF